MNRILLFSFALTSTSNGSAFRSAYVSIKEQKSRKHKNSEIDYLQLVSDTLAAIPGNGTDCREEEQYNQWQIDIMEENARRTGLLFGISG